MEENLIKENFIVDWCHVYLLGWYDANNQGYLTSWDGDLPYVHVVVTGYLYFGPPMWKTPVPDGCILHEIPDNKDPQEYAKEIGGVHAFGWYLKDGNIERVSKET